MVKFHTHAKDRLIERGATEKEVIETVEHGEVFPVKFERTGFRKNFTFNSIWQEHFYATKQVEVYAVQEESNWLVITVITKYF
ncbi:MAG: DUF4258 domain-containing protein [bacterium]